MLLGELNKIFGTLNGGIILRYGIGEPKSWRGSYDEVCFPVEENISVRQCRLNIQKAYDETFYGYKGGEYKFDDFTIVNFESDGSTYTDGEYCETMINEIQGQYDRENLLVNLMINTGE